MSPAENVHEPQPALDLATARIVSPLALAKTALRQDDHDADAVLALRASKRRMTADQVAELAANVVRGEVPPPQTLKIFQQPALTALAYLRCGEAAAGGDPAPAADLFELLRLVAERTGEPIGHAELDLQVHLAARRLDGLLHRVRAGEADPWTAWSVEADLAHPGLDGSAELDNWLAVFNRPLVELGLEPVRLAGREPVFDAVATTAPPASVDGPLITIVMPVFRPGASLRTAVRSLLEQTWANLQIVIVDDASPESYAALFAEMAALDSRVELHRLSTNGGAYRARNHGLQHARGEFIGIQDGDDWSHPRRLERQMARFDDRPELVATLSKAIRCHPDLQVVRVGARPFARNAPSLLFRREQVLARLGQFDQTRKAADTEFIDRIETTFGPESVETLQEPLSLYQLTSSSLSREDLRLEWLHEDRVSYHAAFKHWHAQLAAGTADPWVSTPPPRPFPAPAAITGDPASEAGPDVVILADWRGRSIVATGLLDEVTALADAGVSVGLARGETLHYATERRFFPHADVQELVNDRRVTVTSLGSTTSCGVLIVRDPHLLTCSRPANQVGLQPGRVVVVADRHPRPAVTPRISYAPAQIESVGRAMFGCDVEWLPATSVIAAALTDAGAAGPVHPPRVLEVVRPYQLAPAAHRAPVIGWSDASPSGAERSDRGTLDALAPSTSEVRVLEAPKRLEQHPHAWTSVDPAVTTTDEFLDGCDYFVGAQPKIAGISLVRPLIDAMVHGCVVIADDACRPFLGAAALYLSDATVEQHVAAHPVGSPAFDAQRQRALAFCAEQLSPEAYVGWVRGLLGGSPAASEPPRRHGLSGIVAKRPRPDGPVSRDA